MEELQILPSEGGSHLFPQGEEGGDSPWGKGWTTACAAPPFGLWESRGGYMCPFHCPSRWNPLPTSMPGAAQCRPTGSAHLHHVIAQFSRSSSVLVCWASTLHQCLLLGPLLNRTNQLFLNKAQMWLQGQIKQISPCQVWLPGLMQHSLPRGPLHPQVSLSDSMLQPNAHPQFPDTPLLHFRSWQLTKSVWEKIIRPWD